MFSRLQNMASLLTFWIFDFLIAIALVVVGTISKFQLYGVWDVSKKALWRWEGPFIKIGKILSHVLCDSKQKLTKIGASARPRFMPPCPHQATHRLDFGFIQSVSTREIKCHLYSYSYSYWMAPHFVIKFSCIWKLWVKEFKNVRCPREDVVADNTPMSCMKKLSFHPLSMVNLKN